MGTVINMCNNIRDALGANAYLSFEYGPTEVKHEMDLPAVVVFPGIEEVARTNTQQHSFGSDANAVQTEDITIYADHMIADGTNILEDFEMLSSAWDACRTILRSQAGPSPFGDSNIKTFQWRIQYDDKIQGDYIGFRVTITVNNF